MINTMKRVGAQVYRSTTLRVILIAVSGTLLFIQFFAHTTIKYHSLTFDLTTRIGTHGGTVIAVPPVGRIFLETHWVPWQLVVTLSEIDFQKLEEQLSSIPPQEEWRDVFQHEATKAMLIFFALVAGWGIAGGMVFLIIFRYFPSHAHGRDFWVGSVISLAIIGILIGGTVLSFDSHAIEHPKYQGVLASAPWVMQLISMGIDNIEVIGANLKKIPQELPLLYKQAGAIKNLSDLQTDLAVLHVSDIHNNPAAFKLIQELVANFKIKLIIDTGDLTDYSTPLEAEITRQFAAIKIPYLFIPGNHDSPLILERLKPFPNVKVLTEGVVKIKGLVIAGIADPSSLTSNPEVAGPDMMEDYRARLVEMVAKYGVEPDVVAAHNRGLTPDFIGKTPLVVHGHDHRAKIVKQQGTVIDDAGTTGAAGLRGLAEPGISYSATILYWKKDSENKLRLYAADSIKINGGEGLFTIDRHTF